MILNGGGYDLEAMAELNGIAAWGFKIALWSYTGTQNWSDEAPGLTMYNRLTELGVADHAPALGHVYRFQLDLDEAQTTLNDTLGFLRDVIRRARWGSAEPAQPQLRVARVVELRLPSRSSVARVLSG